MHTLPVEGPAEGVDDDAAPVRHGRSVPLQAWAAPAAVALAVAVGVALRFVQRSPLWLDEALSVNISALPVGDLLDALRHDGHPPLYYLLLHGWMQIVGEGDQAVRALSGLFSVAALPLMWVAGRRLAGTSGGRWALVVGALTPYLVRYATETRMYSLVMLLTLVGYLVLDDALRSPTAARLVGLAGVSGALLLTHYWSFYLLGAVGLLLAVRWWRVPPARPTTTRVIGAVAAGGLLFLPWLGGFLYQMGHTGTPWGEPFRPTAVVQAVLSDLGGGNLTEATLAGTLTSLLAVAALFTVRSWGHEMQLDLRTTPVVRREIAVVGLVLVLGSTVSFVTSSSFQSRYAAVFVPILLLAVAVGITRLPGAARAVVGVAWVVLALGGVVWVNYYQRSQSNEAAAAIAAEASPGDVVVYCPDQLGPAYSRAMPDGLVELAYPTLGPPDRVDWVDYAERNAAADPVQLADEIRRQAAGNTIFLVWMSEYRTFGQQCEQLIAELGPADTLVVQDHGRFYEPAFVHWWPASADEPAA